MTVCQCQLTTMISFKISGKLLLRPVEQVTRQQFLMELTPVTQSQMAPPLSGSVISTVTKSIKLGNRAGEWQNHYEESLFIMILPCRQI